jgi:hypothetical protein
VFLGRPGSGVVWPSLFPEGGEGIIKRPEKSGNLPLPQWGGGWGEGGEKFLTSLSLDLGGA